MWFVQGSFNMKEQVLQKLTGGPYYGLILGTIRHKKAAVNLFINGNVMATFSRCLRRKLGSNKIFEQDWFNMRLK